MGASPSRRTVLAGAAALLVAGCSDPQGTPPPGRLPWLSGSQEGSFDSAPWAPYAERNRSRQVDAFGAWRGAVSTVVGDYTGDRSWTSVLMEQSRLQALSTQAGLGRAVDLAVVPFPKAGRGYTLAAAAAGAYTSYWRTLAERLVLYGLNLPSVYLRFAWEMNGGYFHWGVLSPAQGPSAGSHLSQEQVRRNISDYKTMFRRFAAVVRSVAHRVNIVWCANTGGGPGTSVGSDGPGCYPGADVVDVVALDVYDQSWAPGTYPYRATESARERTARQDRAWADLLHARGFGLAWFIDFAVREGKPLAFSEWACINRIHDRHGGADNPSFIKHMFDVMWQVHRTSPGLGYECYFNQNDGAKSTERLGPPGYQKPLVGAAAAGVYQQSVRALRAGTFTPG